MPNWLEDMLNSIRAANYPGGGEPAPTPSFPLTLQSASQDKPADSNVLKQTPVTDAVTYDSNYPGGGEPAPTPSLLASAPVAKVNLGGDVQFVGGGGGGERGTTGGWKETGLLDTGGASGSSVGTTGSWADTTLPPVTTVSPLQSTSALDITRAANANAATDTSMTFRGTDFAPRAELVKMPAYQTPGIPSQMVSPEQPEVRRAELVRLPDLFQKGLPPSTMVAPYTTPPLSQQPQPQVRRGILVAPQVQPAIPVTGGSPSVTAAPRAQSVAAPSTYDLSTYTADQRAAFLDKIKNLGPNDQVPASIYESVVPLPKVQAQAQTTQPISSYSADKINSIFGNGMLAGRGQQFINVAQKYNLNPYVLASISALETGYGTSHALAAHNNLGGMMDPKTPNQTGFLHFNSIDEGLDAFASLIKRRYANQGLNTIGKMAPVYSPPDAINDPKGTNKTWGPNVSSIYRRLAS